MAQLKLKFIFWRSDLKPNEKGEIYADIHFLVGHNQASLSNLGKMADELRQTFPQATNDEICGGKVYQSSHVQGFSIITWGAYIPKGEYPDWYQETGSRMEYCW
jgi:hypothetical protein